MSSKKRAASVARVECRGCGAVLGDRLLSDFAVPAGDGPGKHLRCPACGSTIHVPRP